jgi:hypothetical protein
VEKVQYLLQYVDQVPSMCGEAACEAGDVAVLQLLLDAGLALDSQLLRSAASSGNLKILEMLSQRHTGPFTQPEQNTMTARALNGGHVHILQWLASHEFAADAGFMLLYALGSGSMPTVVWVTDRFDVTLDQVDGGVELCAYVAAEGGSLEVFQYCLSLGAQIDEQSGLSAARSRTAHSIHLLKWLHENGHLLLTEDLCNAAATTQSLPKLQYLTEVAGCPCSEYQVLRSAVQRSITTDTEAVLEYILDQRDIELSADDLKQLKTDAAAPGRAPYALERLQQDESRMTNKSSTS